MDDECLWELERRMRIADDTRKEFCLNKSDDSWYWFERGDELNSEAWYGPFASFYDALCDAVEPYIDDEEESE